ncbi:MAG: hypothetical protein ABL907_16525 [Hyphomicrobium sp.]
MGKSFGVIAIVAAVGFGSMLVSDPDVEAQRRIAGVVQIAAETGARPVKKLAPDAQLDRRAAMALAISQELTRVGCLAPGLTPGWTEVTQSAAQRFVDRIGAPLPVATPDYILLTLLRGHTGTSCGAPCVQAPGSRGTACAVERVAAQSSRPVQRSQPATPPLAPLSLLTKRDLAGQPRPNRLIATASASATMPAGSRQVTPAIRPQPKSAQSAQEPVAQRDTRQREVPQKGPASPPAASAPRRQVTVASARIEPRPEQAARPKPTPVKASASRSADIFHRSRDNAP